MATYDCIIVGGGPAGATAAYHLAKNGRSVLVLEKEPGDNRKPCGGGVSPAIAQWFDFDLSPAISLKVKRLRYTWKGEDPVDIQLQTAEPMWMVRREVFDLFLLAKAAEVGAEIRDNTTVSEIEFAGDRWTVRTDKDTVSATYLVAADGANSFIARELGIKPGKLRQAAALEVPANVGDDATINFDLGSIKNGFIWNFPKTDGYSIGGSTFVGGDNKKLPDMLTEYTRQLQGITGTGEAVSYPLCLWDGDRDLHAQNALAVGDAASLADPLTAEGIRPAIFSGVKAAEAIDSALGGNAAALENYTRAIAEEWGTEMTWAQRLAAAFYRFPGIAYKVIVKKPNATQIMMKILCGEQHYSAVAKTAIDRLTKSWLPGRG